MISTRAEGTDRDLVEAVRAGDDAAFDELYRRYRPRITAYVRRMVHDPGRAEDLAQDAFFSALRRMRATDAEIVFKPWIFEIARNAAIDHWRRTSRAEEISVEEDGRLRPSDRLRLTGAAGPHATVAEKERFDHLRGALDELCQVHSRILVLRELEGLSYREIAERLDLTESSVQSALFRARRRLESEYSEISEGRRCAAMRTVMGRMAEGLGDKREAGRLARHARRCHVCRRRARELGVEPVPPLTRLRRRAAALLPFPLLPRSGGSASGGAAGGGQGAGVAAGMLPAGAQVGAVVAERAVAIVAAAAIAGAGGAALGGADGLVGDREPQRAPAPEQGAPGSGPAGAGGSHAGGARRSGAAGAATSPEPGGRHHGQHGQAGPADGNAAGPDGGAPGAGSTGGLPDAKVPNGLPEAKGPGHLPAPKAPAVDGRPPADVGLPSLPDLPPEPGGGRGGPPADPPRLPDAPSPPSVQAPQAPEVPLEPPGVEVAPPAPVDPPAAPNRPPIDAGVQPGAVTAIGGG
jgi:RNA polymerase sigma factor (sigma-70 family)